MQRNRVLAGTAQEAIARLRQELVDRVDDTLRPDRSVGMQNHSELDAWQHTVVRTRWVHDERATLCFRHLFLSRSSAKSCSIIVMAI
jgi:hypothetical protein